ARPAARTRAACRLGLAGGGADDDPEGPGVLSEVRAAAGNDPDVRVVLLPSDAHLEINALQRAAAVVVQKSLREGFGLAVAEAVWTGGTGLASDVGPPRRCAGSGGRASLPWRTIGAWPPPTYRPGSSLPPSPRWPSPGRSRSCTGACAARSDRWPTG